MIHPKADANGDFTCSLCGYSSPIEEEFELNYYRLPMCKREFEDFMHYGCD